MKTDTDLLREYAKTGSEGAFSELVRRHVDFIHSVTLKNSAGDAHVAKDATQLVFQKLAANAKELEQYPTLAGWLYRTSRNAVFVSRRQQARRVRASGGGDSKDILRSPHHGQPQPSPASLKLLDGFKWFCGLEDRELVETIQADLRRDLRVMASDGRSRWFIRCVLAKHTLGVMAPILWDKLIRVLKQLARAAELFRKLRF